MQPNLSGATTLAEQPEGEDVRDEGDDDYRQHGRGQLVCSQKLIHAEWESEQPSKGKVDFNVGGEAEAEWSG